MNKQLLRYLQLWLQTLDLVVLNIIVVLSQWATVPDVPPASSHYYYQYLIFLNVSWIVLSWINQVYSTKNISTFETFSKQTKSLYVSWLCAIMIYLFFFRQFELSRFFIIVSLGAFSIGLLLNRFGYLVMRNQFNKRDHFKKRILILGFNAAAKKLATKLERSENNNIIGFLENSEQVRELTHYPILGAVDETLSLSEKFEVNQIFSTISPEQNSHIYPLMQEAEARFIRFRIVPDLSYFIKTPVHVEFFDDMPMLSLRKEPLEDIGNRIKKRIMDVAISLFAIIFILSWLVPLLALLIYLESPGPIFFAQYRSGKNNRPFKCYKFRSMKPNNEADKRQATKGDNRFTKIGKLLRKTSLDEFPQFYNVLKGDMSVVGPRPHMLKHTEDYSKIVDAYMLRQFLKPGITGWAQINGFRGEIHGHEEIEGRVECDMWYSENWTLWLDLRIIFLTAYNIFKGEENAY